MSTGKNTKNDAYERKIDAMAQEMVDGTWLANPTKIIAALKCQPTMGRVALTGKIGMVYEDICERAAEIRNESVVKRVAETAGRHVREDY